MRERGTRRDGAPLRLLPREERLAERQLSKRENGAEAGERRDLADEERPAPVELGRGRPIVRRSAAGRRRHVRIHELQTVVEGDGSPLVREESAMERSEEEVARGIAGEDASRPVSPVSGRREAYDQQARPRVAESRNRTRPVAPAPEASWSLPRGGLPKANEARARAASDDLARHAVKRPPGRHATAQELIVRLPFFAIGVGVGAGSGWPRSTSRLTFPAVSLTTSPTFCAPSLTS